MYSPVPCILLIHWTLKNGLYMHFIHCRGGDLQCFTEENCLTNDKYCTYMPSHLCWPCIRGEARLSPSNPRGTKTMALSLLQRSVVIWQDHLQLWILLFILYNILIDSFCCLAMTLRDYKVFIPGLLKFSLCVFLFSSNTYLSSYHSVVATWTRKLSWAVSMGRACWVDAHP